jgi:UDP-glucose 4-epimerase
MVVVFGGSGFVGRYLSYQLTKQGYEVLCVGKSKNGNKFCDENGIQFLQMDITRKEDFAKLPIKNIEAVVHLVALIVELNPSTESLLNNIIFGTFNVLEYCKNNNIKKVINTSSHKVYCDLWKPEFLPIKVNQAGKFSGHASPYILSKMAAEELIKFYYEEYGIEGITFRLTGVKGYGEIIGSLGEDGSYKKSAIECFIEKAIRGEQIEIWGKHTAKRDHIYVKDVADCIIESIKSKGKSGVYNLASGQGVTIEDEAKVIIEGFSSKENISELCYRPEIEDTTPSWIYDISDTTKAFDWQPKYSYKEMIVDYKKESESKRFAHYHYVKKEDRPTYW